jgi:hypothetical protein
MSLIDENTLLEVYNLVSASDVEPQWLV